MTTLQEHIQKQTPLEVKVLWLVDFETGVQSLQLEQHRFPGVTTWVTWNSPKAAYTHDQLVVLHEALQSWINEGVTDAEMLAKRAVALGYTAELISELTR